MPVASFPQVSNPSLNYNLQPPTVELKFCFTKFRAHISQEKKISTEANGLIFFSHIRTRLHSEKNHKILSFVILLDRFLL